MKKFMLFTISFKKCFNCMKYEKDRAFKLYGRRKCQKYGTTEIPKTGLSVQTVIRKSKALI